MDKRLPQEPRRGCVVACADGNWAWQSAFVLMRSVGFDRDGVLDHHLYLAGPVDQRVLDILPPEITLHRIAELPEAYAAGANGHVPAATMLRFTALEELGRRYKRVIYLDGDVFQAWGSLADMLAVDMGRAPLAGVLDRSQWSRGRVQWFQDYLDALAARRGVECLHYFNAGVLMIHGPAYVAADLSAEAVSFIGTNPDVCRRGDQSALNAVMAGRWCEISPGWNWQMSHVVSGLTASRRPRLIHFTDRLKPWEDTLRLLPPEAFDAMFHFLQTHGLTDLLSDKAPCHFDYRIQERLRARKMDEWAGNAFAKREAVKAYLDRKDFADHAAGLRSFG